MGDIGIGTDSIRRRSLDEQEPDRPAPTPPAAQRAGAHELTHEIAYHPDLFGGDKKGCGAGDERSVARRGDRDLPMDLDGSTSQASRLANLSRLTQLDGDPATRIDHATCGPMCLVAALYVVDPGALRNVAANELAQGAKDGRLATWAKNMGVPVAKLRSELQAVQSGKASARQLAVLAQVLLQDLRTRDPRMGSNGNGTDAPHLQILTRTILAQESGVTPPPIRFELRTVTGGGHWVAEIDVASRADVEEGAKTDTVVVYDPWPWTNGRAQSTETMTKQDADKQLDGVFRQEWGVSSDGTLRRIR